MHAKEYLKKIRNEREYLRQLRKRKENLHIDYNGISGIDYSEVKIQCTPVNKLEEQGWKLMERIQLIDKEIEEISLSIDDKLEQMRSLDNSIYSQILFMRYSDYETFEQIAVDLGYDYHYVCRLHGEALVELQNIIQKDTKR